MTSPSSGADLRVERQALERSSHQVATAVLNFEQVTTEVLDTLQALSRLIETQALAQAVTRFATTSVVAERRVDEAMRELSTVVAAAAHTYLATDTAIADGIEA